MGIEKKEFDEDIESIDSREKQWELDPPGLSERHSIGQGLVWNPSDYKSKADAKRIEEALKSLIGGFEKQ